MKSKVQQLSGEDIGKFTALVRKKQSGRLTANQLGHLDLHSYNQYIHKIKQDARNSLTYKNKKDHPLRTSQRKITDLEKRNPQQQLSHYYSNKYQIMSLKEFVIILEQAKKKQDAEERMHQRHKQRQFARTVGRSIQSSQSHRNLRLTSSSAHRINRRLTQNKYEHIFQ